MLKVIVVASLGLLTILSGRFFFGRWYNHLTLFGVTWSISLLLFLSGVIYYYPLQIETWIIIIFSWFFFLIGSVTVVLVKFLYPRKIIVKSIFTRKVIIEALKKCLMLFNSVSLIAVLYNGYIIVSRYGGIINVLILGNIVRSDFVHDEIPGLIPYISSFIFVSNLFAGIYTAAKNKINLASVISIFINIAYSILTMSRASLLFGFLLLTSGYFLFFYLSQSTINKDIKIKKYRYIFLFALLIVVSAEIVRANRGVYESYEGLSSTSKKVLGTSFLTPSLVFYLSSHYGVLNQYLRKDREYKLPLRYTLATFWRFIDKFGFEIKVPYYQVFYKIPASTNTGTYLREIHADFGDIGVFVIPYFLGIIATVFWYKVNEQMTLSSIIILAFLYSIIGMSFLVWLPSQGWWVVSFFIALMSKYLFNFFVKIYDKYNFLNQIL